MRAFWVCLLLTACGDDTTTNLPVATPEHNPLGTNDDILPFPSSLYERADPASPTGYDLDVPVGAFPGNTSTGAAFDPTPLARRHGWSPVTTILWAAPGGVDPATLTGQDAMATSLTLASSTLILDVTANQFVAHFAEVDVERGRSPRQPGRLSAPGAAADRRASLRGRDHEGGQGERRQGVRAHRRRSRRCSTIATTVTSCSIRHRPRLRDAVAALEAAGIARDDLLVAWDFTVDDDATTIQDSVAARDVALAAMGTDGANLTYTITSDTGTVNGDPRIARRIELDFEAPAVSRRRARRVLSRCRPAT